MAIHIGDPAPDFALPPAPGPEIVRLSSFRGERPVVVLFFPLAFSPVCTEEMCSVADDWSRWESLGAAVVGISVDSPFVVRRFADETGAPFPILSDFNREVGAAWGVLYEDYWGLRGVAKRSAFVVDPMGIVRYAWVSDDDSVQPPFDEIRRVVEEIRTA